MAGVVLQARLAFDEIGDPPRGPEPRAVSQSLGTLLETALQSLQLLGLQPRLTSRPASFAQSIDSLGFPGLVPAIDRLFMDAQPAGDFGLRAAFVEEFGGL